MKGQSIFLAVGVLSLALVLHSCGRSDDENTTVNVREVSLDSSTVDGAIPMADGSAYVTSQEGGVWLIRGGTALLVRLENNAPFTLMYYDDFIPTTDGGAYVLFQGKTWHLRDGRAIELREVETLTDMDTVSANLATGLWPLFIRERAWRKSLQDQMQPPDSEDIGEY